MVVLGACGCFGESVVTVLKAFAMFVLCPVDFVVLFFVGIWCLFLAMCFEGVDFSSCLVVVRLMMTLYVSPSCVFSVLLTLCVDVSRFVANRVSPLFPGAILICREDHDVEFVLCEGFVPGGVLVYSWFSIRYCYVVVFFVILVFVCPLGVRVWPSQSVLGFCVSVLWCGLLFWRFDSFWWLPH